MIVDGRAIAQEIYQGIRNALTHLDFTPHLTVFTCSPNFETQKYLQLKRRKAIDLGLGINVIEFPENITTAEVIQSVIHSQMQTDGIIVQLPFPAHINVEEVLNCIPAKLDVDVIHYDGSNQEVLPPVVGAIKEIGQRHDVLWATRNTIVIGEGKLVGQPAAIFAKKMGAQVSVINRTTENSDELIKQAHIIISGAGVPGLITPDKISEQVIIFDAGTSEEGGVLKGDALPSCAEKSSIFTPVPGGIGPITIAVLLKNLVILASKH
jgi:methylenetetrahydrofolate dehydrogenase (NADP+) / methenyltetrahydrofolate cyclohydrolase